MKIKCVVLIFIVLSTGCFTQETCQAGVFGKRIIKHRANMGGECEDRNRCVGILGDKLYNYQRIGRHEPLQESADIARGELNIGQEGVEIDESLQEHYGLDATDVQNVRDIHQYVGIKRPVRGAIDGRVLNAGSITSTENNTIHNVENIVEVDGSISGVRSGHLGRVTLNESKMRKINNSTVVDGKIKLRRRQGLSIGGVVIEDAVITDYTDSSVFIKD